MAGEYPLLAQVSSPSTDKDAYVPIHPGAAAFFDGDEKTIFDKYGDQFFYGSMMLGTIDVRAGGDLEIHDKGYRQTATSVLNAAVRVGGKDQ